MTLLPPSLNLVTVCGLPYPACPVEIAPGNLCISYLNHEPWQSPSGPHCPRHPVPCQRPDGPAFDPLRMRA